MNRLDRLTTILIQLQSKRLLTATEMAERFDISIRTIYRDIRTLREAGVPIGEEEGKGYFLVDGYQLPPVMFSQEEASALVSIGKMLEFHTDKSLRRNYESALMKIKAVLRTGTQEQLEYLDAMTGIPDIPTHESVCLSAFQKAIPEHSAVRITYVSGRSQEQTEREIQPYALYFTGFNWSVIAFCTLRNALREFRLERIKDLKETRQSFQPDPNFHLQEYLNAREKKLFPDP